jgi:Na+-transporting methylmalonyl-CoA/oxaloacetate decarboxylase gamma subunit
MKNRETLGFRIWGLGYILEILVILVILIQTISCAKKSMHQENARTLYSEYKSAFKYYSEAENDYVILLSNLEKYPKDEYLLIRKQILRKEIEQNRMLMLQARGEFEKALRDWDIAVQKMETPLPSDTMDLRQIFGFPTPKDTLPFNDY